MPPGAAELAHSDVGPAAFALGPHLGVQFHPEVTTEVIAAWARSEAELAKLGDRPGGADRGERAAGAAGARTAWALFDGWWGRAS